MKFSGKMMRDLALLLALVLVMSSLTVGICALGDQRGTPKAAETETKAAEDTDGSIQDIFTQSDAAQFKDETVYVLTDANGTVNKVIVSDWIKNSAGDSTIRDTSGLSDIQVTKGDATYTLDGDNLCVWDTKGGDVYYQGTSDQEIPVSMKLTYTLDGSPVAAEDLAGKSGKVTIRFDYENQQKQTVQIDGKNTQMYVPFLMLTGLALDNSKFTNITVTNGKVINDGERSLVVGCALPGMQEDLDVDTDTLEVPDYVEITADVTDFELTTTVTLAANNFLSSLDLDSVSTLDDLEKALTTLDDSTAKLLDGATKLSEGLTTLLDESGSLVEGIGKLQEVASGASSVNTNLGTLRGYLQQLDTGLNTLSGKSSALNEGAKQTFAALLSSADTQLAAAGLQLPALTIDNYGTVLDGAVAGMTGTQRIRRRTIRLMQPSVRRWKPIARP
jgi:putative membrane protein